jgi:hypothetical protein
MRLAGQQTRERKMDAIKLRNGLVVVWDATEGAYYVPSVDMFMTIEEFNANAGLA